MNNTLIDNSDKLKLVETLKELISNPRCNHLQIATGYWDIPGTSLLYDVLRGFFERGGRLQLLIGKEPQLRSYQLRPLEEHEDEGILDKLKLGRENHYINKGLFNFILNAFHSETDIDADPINSNMDTDANM